MAASDRSVTDVGGGNVQTPVVLRVEARYETPQVTEALYPPASEAEAIQPFPPGAEALYATPLAQESVYAEPQAAAVQYDEDYPLEERDYKKHEHGHYSPPKKQCYPQTITKYRTIYKDRKANVFNKVEVRNPRPQVHKTKETRHTTIRYPVFITQVIKPLLTQVETKVKPMFFTKTLKRIKTIVFTVTGIGQVTVTSVKYEKEYVTRCQKKGYGHGGGGHKGHGREYHRREDYDDEDYREPYYVEPRGYATADPTGSYDETYTSGSRRRSSTRHKRSPDLAPSIAELELDRTLLSTNPLSSAMKEEVDFSL